MADFCALVKEKRASRVSRQNACILARPRRSRGRQRRQKLGYKIRQCELQKVPYLLIVGEKEVADGVVSVRRRKEGDKGSMTVAQFLEMTADDRKVVR